MKHSDGLTQRSRADMHSLWQQQLQDQRDAKLAEDLKRREHELLPRFGQYYQRLRALPRRWRRGIGRRLRQSLAGVALLLALGHGAAFAATINVDGTDCTLADAITAANTDAATGSCSAGSGDDTLNIINDITLTNELPSIDSGVIIEGNGSTIERSLAAGTPDFRILTSEDFYSGALTLNEVTITGGVSDEGGGISVRGDLTITNSTISGNTAAVGGGISSTGDLTITNSTISDNNAQEGGGVFLRFFYGTIENTTVSGNVASDIGGGIYVGAEGFEEYGGGCTSRTGEIVVRNSVISGNTSSQGSELYTERDSVCAECGAIRSQGYNLFGESGNANADAFEDSCSSNIEFAPTDIIATSDGTQATALENILEPTLGDNGGLTKTLALVAGSPAIDAAGPDCPPPDTDQRGFPRPEGAACDIGAFEGAVGLVNDRVTFNPDPSSYKTTRNKAGCPSNYWGKYLFEAALTNVGGQDLNALSVEIEKLTRQNLVLAPDGELLGEGDWLAVAREDDYADGILGPSETVDMPFKICLKKRRSFQFFVDVYGSVGSGAPGAASVTRRSSREPRALEEQVRDRASREARPGAESRFHWALKVPKARR